MVGGGGGWWVCGCVGGWVAGWLGVCVCVVGGGGNNDPMIVRSMTPV